jgi:hypothetical protein
MSRPSKKSNIAIVTAGDMSATISSLPIAVDKFTACSIQASYTGSPVGTFTVQASNDVGTNPTGNAANVSGIQNWTTVTAYTQAITAAGSVLWSFDDLNYAWLRCVYTRTSGSGTLTVRAVAKEDDAR